MGDLDGSRCGPVEGQLFPVGPLEADGVPVVARSFVQPRRRVLAGVGEPLVGGGAQQLQEGQLDHVHGGAISIHIGELREGQGEGGASSARVPAEQDTSQAPWAALLTLLPSLK